jgi:hypothetical protein
VSRRGNPGQWDAYRRPELFLADVIRKNALGSAGALDNFSFLHRAIVLAVDVQGGRLENPDGSGHVEHKRDGKTVAFQALRGPKNPPGALKARIITSGFDQFFSDADARVFWPLFYEHDSMPIKPGEHAYVMFEDAELKHGLWVCRVPGHEGANFVRGESQFAAGDPGSLTNLFSDTAAASRPADSLATDSAASERLASDQKLAGLFGI